MVKVILIGSIALLSLAILLLLYSVYDPLMQLISVHTLLSSTAYMLITRIIVDNIFISVLAFFIHVDIKNLHGQIKADKKKNSEEKKNEIR